MKDYNDDDNCDKNDTNGFIVRVTIPSTESGCGAIKLDKWPLFMSFSKNGSLGGGYVAIFWKVVKRTC